MNTAKKTTDLTHNTRINSPSYKQFVEVPHADIQRSTFDRSHGVKTTFDAGELIPVYCDEMLPGDTFSCQLTAFARLATPIHPTMDNAFMDTHFFSVPLRLIWDDFEEFMGETKTYTASGSARLDETPDFTVAAPVPPTITAPGGGEAESSLSDYMGIPTKVAGLEFSALWHRAYTLIWNDWFRDENLQKPATLLTTSGADATAYALLNRGKRHDYFTSALPWPQKGADVTLPLNRMFSRSTIYDYYWPTLSTIGEQAVLNKEIYADGSAADETVFGYQERYGEYRYKPSLVTGRFRSNATTSLETWHYAQDYSALPVLGQSWIQQGKANVQRTLAVATEPQFIFDSLFKLRCTRPMPITSVPGGTHF